MDALNLLEFAGAAIGGAAVTLVGMYRFFRPRSECLLTHSAIDKALADAERALAERRTSTHELRDIVTPLVTRVAILENTLGHVTTVVESIAERVGANGFEPRTRTKRNRE